MGRILGIDYGDRRIGFAVSDPTRFLASPHSVHERKRPGDDVQAVLDLCRTIEIDLIVVGLPLNMDGSRGTAVDKVEDFIRRLRGKTDRPIITADERLSTVTAEGAMIEGGVSRKKRKGRIDQLAAQIILQQYLDEAGGSLDLAGHPGDRP
jgi:putative holliday junction resolvase